jgi:hypothetical protein
METTQEQPGALPLLFHSLLDSLTPRVKQPSTTSLISRQKPCLLSQNPAVEDLTDSFDQHISFGLYETSTTTADKFPIVFIPVSRSFLRNLSLELPVPLSELPPPNIAAFTRVLLSAFTALQTLHLGRNSFEAALIPAIQAVSTLEDLIFSHGSGAVAADLKALVANPQHLPRLRLLTPGQIVEAT